MSAKKDEKSTLLKRVFTDISTWVLLFSNILTIIFAVTESWDFSTILWVYWFQSMIIGAFQFLKILSLKSFSTEGFTINGRSVDPTDATKIFTAFFFAFHYGFFHFGYFIFLLAERFPTGLMYILIASGIFFVNHLFSFIYNRKKDEVKKKNIGKVMFFPYARIVPMHLIIIFGSALGSISIVFFLVLKTIADGAMHLIEHSEG